MTNINNLPTMAFHFFTAPNKVLITDDGYNNIVTAEIDENFDKDFVLDAKSFDILKKLKNKKYKIDKEVTITGDNGEFKCNQIDKTLPQLHLTDIIYENDYDTNVLKSACKYVGNNNAKQVLCGVLFNDKGDVYATDSYKMYYASSGASSDCWWSAPTSFINLVGSTGHIAFTETKVIYKGDYDVYSSVYQGKIPDLSRMLDTHGDEITFKNNDNLKLFASEAIDFKPKNGVLIALLEDNEKSFKIEIKYEGTCNNGFKLGYKNFLQLLDTCGDEINLIIDNGKVKANDCVIVCGMR